MSGHPRLILKPGRAKPFLNRHMWLFAGSVDAIEGDPKDGDPIDIVSNTGAFVARGIFNSQSKIRARLYCWEPDRDLDATFFRERLTTALRHRERLGLTGPGRAYRLLNSEGDGVSGCVIDVYDRWAAVQFTALGVANRAEMFVEILNELISPKGIYLRTEKGVGQLEGLGAQDGILDGEVPPEQIEIREHDLTFLVNLAEGQKTGFYLDQRANRAAVMRYAPKSRALDAFCYTGGFGLNLAASGVESVLGIDGSESALDLARTNARRNGLDERCSFRKADVFVAMEELAQQGERFGTVVLDPPKFARGRSAVPDALRGYRRLITLGLRLLESDGILVMCCCSGLISAEMIEEVLSQVAASERRFVQLLERRGADADHPIALSCPESEYLKCLILRVVQTK